MKLTLSLLHGGIKFGVSCTVAAGTTCTPTGHHIEKLHFSNGQKVRLFSISGLRWFTWGRSENES